MSSTLILLKSEEGLTLLDECKKDGGLYQPYLYNIFSKQIGESACGLATASMILSAPYAAAEQITDSRIERVYYVAARKKLPYVEENMFTFPETLKVITKEKLNDEHHGGLTLDQVTQLLENFGCQVKKVRVDDDTVKGVEVLRSDVKSTLSCADSRSGLSVNYHMDVLGQGCPYGHFSPLAAYHTAIDRVLIMDTWRDTHECWTTLDNLYKAMNTVDSECGLKRGYIVSTAPQKH